MSSNRGLLRTDLVVRFDPVTRSITFHTISPVSGMPMTNAIHEMNWSTAAEFEDVVDVGSAVSAHLFAPYPDRFCSADDWERIAATIRAATGRDEEA
jgi:hypothetical protein